ncbi:MAG: hypothetical protein ACJ736_43570 [Streptomyces sp.]
MTGPGKSREPSVPQSGALLALVYLVAVFALDYLSVEQGKDAAAVVLSVITFPRAL